MIEISRVEAIIGLMTWCLTYDYELEILDLNAEELAELLVEINDKQLTLMAATEPSTYKIFGITIRYSDYPKYNYMRRRYLQLINSPVWIEWLAQEMEQYA